ncbi:MAG: CDP-diacylglycerol--serine O-phosphatidyltransferase [Deltaproteobacteria bacterium]|nr:CDP-diacylglycerol--serine O-phosphatidyltransferase [Deltaproteobacteria bacterium]
MKKKKKKSGRRRRGIYILPNLFTSASLFSGFFAIVAAMDGRFEAAAVAIIISAVLDGLDGRIARLTNTTTQFGVEYDSLADLIAFGVAPGILAFQWALKPFGRLGWLASFMFVICGALRLARFNVQKTHEDASYFKGLPIPAAASFVAAMILFIESWDGDLQIRSALIIAMFYTLSFLMVSTLHYYSFKKIDIHNKKPFNVLLSVILVSLIIAYAPKTVIFLILSAYVISGPVITFYRLFRRLPLRKAKSSAVREAEAGEETTAKRADV